MKKDSLSFGFYSLMGAQFFSSLADNALLIVAIYYLVFINDPEFVHPLLKLSFVLSYIFLAPFVGALSDAFPKSWVMFVTNIIKVIGCSLLFVGVHPLLAYGLVGLAAAAYSPAKYGLLTEIVPSNLLVRANGWLEGLTVASIILGTVLGGYFTSQGFAHALGDQEMLFDLPFNIWGSLFFVIFIYALAAIINLWIPHPKVDYGRQKTHPKELLLSFLHCNRTLWRDREGKIVLAGTSCAWAVGACLQFAVLEWSQKKLGVSLDKASYLMGVVAVGLTIGAVIASRVMQLENALNVLRLRLVLAVAMSITALVTSVGWAVVVLLVAGALTGFFIVPMNALLQHRGYTLLSAGHSIAVQNFNENLAIILALAVYSTLLKIGVDINIIIVLIALFLLISWQFLWSLYRKELKQEATLKNNETS